MYIWIRSKGWGEKKILSGRVFCCQMSLACFLFSILSSLRLKGIDMILVLMTMYSTTHPCTCNAYDKNSPPPLHNTHTQSDVCINLYLLSPLPWSPNWDGMGWDGTRYRYNVCLYSMWVAPLWVSDQAQFRILINQSMIWSDLLISIYLLGEVEYGRVG